MPAHQNLAGTGALSRYLNAGGWEHVCVCTPRHCCHVCVFTKKPVGSRNRLHGGRPVSAPLLPTGASSGTAELPFPSIFLQNALLCSFRRVNSHLLFTEADTNLRDENRLFAARTENFSPSTVNIYPPEKQQPSYCIKPPNRVGER